MMRCHDGKAPLIRPGKAQTAYERPLQYELPYELVVWRGHLGDVDKVVQRQRAGPLVARGDVRNI